MTSALDAAETSTPTVVLLEGVTGIGKTTLLGEVAGLARARGFQVAGAVTSNLDKFMSFSVVRQLFEGLTTEAEALEAVVGAGRDGAARSGVGGAAAGGFDELSVHQTCFELYQLMSGVAERGPVCLIVDDLQWADVSSLRWLNYLVRRATRLPLAVLLTCTTGVYPADPLQIAEMQLYATRVKIGGFKADELSEFIELMLGRRPEPELVEACRVATGGNPLVLRYLLSAMEEGPCEPDADALKELVSYGPQELGESVLARLNRESGQLVQLARTIAVVEPGDLKLAAEVADMPLPAAADGVRQLVRMGLMLDAEKPQFVHAVIKNAIANSITHAVRDDLHARAAVRLHESQARIAFVARHVQCTTAKLGGWAVHALCGTAEELLKDGDVITAASFLARALQEDLQPDLRTNLLIKLGRAETYFDTRQAAVHFEQALENIEEPELLFDVVSVLSDLLYAEGQEEDVRSALSELIDRICASAPKLSAQLRLVLRVTVPTDEPDESDIAAEDFSGDWRRGDARGRKLAALVAQDLGHRGEDLATCREAALVALSAGAVSFMQDPRMMAAINALVQTDEFDLALWYSTEAIQEARRRKLDLISLLGHTMRSRAHLCCGALERSVDEGRLALAEAQRMNLHHSHPGYAWPLDALLPALLHLGDVEAARELVEPIGLTSPLPVTFHDTSLLHRRGHLRLELGDAAGALADQLECGRRLTSWSAPSPAFLPWRFYAVVAHLRLGQSQEALNLALEDLELARKWTSASTVGRALLGVGMATGGAAALPWLVEADDVLSNAPALLLRAEVLVELGTTRWHHGRQDLAREELARAKAAAQRCGSLPLLAKLAELPPEAVGRPGSSPALPGPLGSQLTPHERRVASLVAEGNSNEEVARKLSASRRAVEFHLTNIYRKLGIRRRTQLAAVLRSSGNGG
ncbi:AAA family ATPase [Lentzea sp. CC55]|nr:AAA family ATPase [Lentzea sp. CC55]